MVMIRLLWLLYMKSARMSDLMFLRTLLILTIWSSNKDINLEILSVSIGTIICHLDGPLIVMLILILVLPELLIIL